MIPQVHKRGQRTIGLLHYLYGPGTHEEHVDPHLVAAWSTFAPDPGRNAEATLKDLQRLLDQPVAALDKGRRPAKHVWHLSVRCAPEDPVLSDEQWGQIARRMVAATGIAPEGDEAACRWAAVRHADDHIHIIATLVREDGRRPRIHNDAKRAQAEARLIEAELGLRRLNTGDGTAAPRPSRAERHKARRQQRERAPREQLREAVRRAVAGAAGEEEFFARLGVEGLLVRRRIAPSGEALGYTVALPDDLNKDGQPVFYSGSKLAPDLSLPRIRDRFTTASGQPSEQQRGDRGRRTGASSAAARRTAAQAVWSALLIIDQGGEGVAAAQIAAAGEVLDALAKTSATHTRRELREAAFAFERASRSHVRAEHRHDRALRQAARDLVYGGPARGGGEDGAATAMVIDMLFFLAVAAANWHSKKQHAQQAAAARQAAGHLRAAYHNAAQAPMNTLHQRGRTLGLPLQRRATQTVREAIPELAERVLSEPGWPALAATLAEAEAAGHAPAPLLAQAAARRELDTAEVLSDVLVWRLRRIADLPLDPAARRHDGPATASRTTPAARTAGRGQGPRPGAAR